MRGSTHLLPPIALSHGITASPPKNKVHRTQKVETFYLYEEKKGIHGTGSVLAPPCMLTGDWLNIMITQS